MDLTKGSQTPFMKTWTTKCTKLGLVLFRLFLWKSKHDCAFGVSGILSLEACIGTKQWKEDKRHWQCLSLRICQEVRLFHFQEVAELASEVTLVHVEMLSKGFHGWCQRLPQALTRFSVAWMQNIDVLAHTNVWKTSVEFRHGGSVEFLHCRNHFVHRRRKNVHLEFFAFLDYIRRFQLVGGKLLDVDLRTELGKQRFLSLLDTL